MALSRVIDIPEATLPTRPLTKSPDPLSPRESEIEQFSVIHVPLDQVSN